MRTLILTTLVAISLVSVGCEGAVGFAPLHEGPGSSPMLLRTDTGGVGHDAGVTYAPDARATGTPDAWSAPDAYRAPSCTPMCTGRSCGSDGCGGTCGSCATGQTCSAAGQCTGGGGGTAVVTLYGTSWCGYCRQARTFFNANHVTFADVDTEAPGGAEAGFAHVARCGQPGSLATPTVIIETGGTCDVMLGWGESQVRRDLGL